MNRQYGVAATTSVMPSAHREDGQPNETMRRIRRGTPPDILSASHKARHYNRRPYGTSLRGGYANRFRSAASGGPGIPECSQSIRALQPKTEDNTFDHGFQQSRSPTPKLTSSVPPLKRRSVAQPIHPPHFGQPPIVAPAPPSDSTMPPLPHKLAFANRQRSQCNFMPSAPLASQKVVHPLPGRAPMSHPNPTVAQSTKAPVALPGRKHTTSLAATIPPPPPVKAEPRSPSPVSRPSLLKQGCKRFILPESCQKGYPNFASHRAWFLQRNEDELKERGLSPVKHMWRTDGLVIDWTCETGVWSNALENPVKNSIEVIENAYGQDIRPQGNRTMKRKSSTASLPQSPKKKRHGIQNGDQQHWSVAYKYDGGQYAPWEIDSNKPCSSSPPPATVRRSPSLDLLDTLLELPDFEYPISPPSLPYDVPREDVDTAPVAPPSPVSTSISPSNLHTNQTQATSSNSTLLSPPRVLLSTLDSPACHSSASEVSEYLLDDEASSTPPLLSLTLSELLHPSLYLRLQAFVRRFKREFDHVRLGLAIVYSPQATLQCRYQAGGIHSNFTTNMAANGRTEISNRLSNMGSRYFCTRTRAEGVEQEFVSVKINAGSPGTIEAMTRSTFDHEHSSGVLTLEQSFTLGFTIPLSVEDDLDASHKSNPWPFSIISHVVTIRDSVFRSRKSFFEEYPWMGSD